MSGRRRASTLFRTAVMLALTTVASAPVAAAPDVGTPVAERTGAGTWDEAACLACGIALVGAGGATILGMAYMAFVFPEAYAGCALICYAAFGWGAWLRGGARQGPLSNRPRRQRSGFSPWCSS